jgi:capsular polysaccharide transport system ATP-binding protein
MIVLENVSKTVLSLGQMRPVLSGVSVQIPSDRRIAIFGKSPEDRKVFIELLSGLTLPTSGRIVRLVRVSFPAGDTGGFDVDLSVRFNVAHAARLYDADVAAVVEFVRDVSELGAAFEKPFGMLDRERRRLVSRIVAYSIPFDVYLLTSEVTKRKDRNPSKDKPLALFEARAQTSGMIMPARTFRSAHEFCDMGMILHEGRVLLFDDLEQAEWASKREKMGIR